MTTMSKRDDDEDDDDTNINTVTPSVINFYSMAHTVIRTLPTIVDPSIPDSGFF